MNCGRSFLWCIKYFKSHFLQIFTWLVLTLHKSSSQIFTPHWCACFQLAQWLPSTSRYCLSQGTDSRSLSETVIYASHFISRKALIITVPDSENMIRHHQNGRTQAMEGHTPGGEGRHPPVGGRHSHTLHGGCAFVHGVQRPISPQVLTKDSRPPSSCHQYTADVFLGLINTCDNRNAPTPQSWHTGGFGNKKCEMRLATINKKRVNQHILENQNEFWGTVH